MAKFKFYLIPVLIFLFSLTVRFLLISKGPYHVDCLGLVIQIEESLRHNKLFYAYGLGYPLHVIFGILAVLILKLFFLHDPFFAVN